MRLIRIGVFLAVVIGAATAINAYEGDPIADDPAPSLDFTSYYSGTTAGDVQSVIAPSCSEPIAESVCTCDCCNCSPWTVQAGALILARTSRSGVLIEDVITGAPVLNVRDFGTPWGAGPDISVQRLLDSGNSLQIRFFDVDSWLGRTTFTTPAIWSLPTNPPLFGLGAADIHATYGTRLYSTELNWLRPTSEWFSWLAGFRWVELYENLNLNADFGTNTADLRFQTANRLYGGQTGANVSIVNRGAARIDGIFKAGLYGNAASNRFAVTQAIGPAFATTDRSGQVAFLGEIGVVGVYQWTDNIALRGGYQLLWLDGVALAPDQVAATRILTQNGINTTGDAFYHGALMGIQANW